MDRAATKHIFAFLKFYLYWIYFQHFKEKNLLLPETSREELQKIPY